jgi:hypothetical protein
LSPQRRRGENALFCSGRHEISLQINAPIINCNPVVYTSADLIRRISYTFSSWNEDVIVVLMIGSDNFERNNTSIYVTVGFGSRFFGNFNTNAGLLCSKTGNENKGEFGAE